MTELVVPLCVVRYEAVVATYLGETYTRLQKLLDHVRTRRCVFFFDEFDTLGKERGDEHETGEINRVVSTLLLQIDRLPSHVVVVTATNHPELLDRAVWCRFQLRLELPRPDAETIARWLCRFGKATGIELRADPRKIAGELEGASFGEVEELALAQGGRHRRPFFASGWTSGGPAIHPRPLTSPERRRDSSEAIAGRK